jgi:DNA-binding response OmpR family regulator
MRAMPQKRILLVEDEPAVRDILSHVLWTEGYQVDVAGTFPEAITFLDTVPYDLVISDWRLPEGNGLLLADIAAELGARTMVMSGYLFQMPGGRAERHETLMKPLRPSEIVAAVERSIGRLASANQFAPLSVLRKPSEVSFAACRASLQSRSPRSCDFNMLALARFLRCDAQGRTSRTAGLI